MVGQEKEWVRIAQEHEPDGAICGFCGNPNDNADDCGWVYVVDVRNGETRNPKNGLLTNPCKPVCESCSKTYLPIHQSYYGVGDR